MDLFKSLEEKIDGKNIKIVFPEGAEPRIIGAAVRLKADHVLEPILLGAQSEVEKVAKANGFHVESLQVIDPEAYPTADFDVMVASFVERRKGKATEEQAREILRDPNYFGTMLVYLGVVDGMVSGIIHSTGETVRPALQIIKTKPGVSRTSGAFVMQRGHGSERYLFSDCAINIDPSAQELAEIAVESAKTAELFDIEPRVSLLSFSTHLKSIRLQRQLLSHRNWHLNIQLMVNYNLMLPTSLRLQHKRHLDRRSLARQRFMFSQNFNQVILVTKLRNVLATSKPSDQSCKA